MKIDHLIGGKPLGFLSDPFSDPGDVGSDWLNLNRGTAGPMQVGFGADASSPGAADLSKPITISFLPPSPTTGGSDASSASLATAQPVALIEDYGAGFPKAGPPGIDFFAKGGHPGGGGGGGGGAPPSYTATHNNMTFTVNWDTSVGNAPSGFVSGFETAVQYFLNTLTGPATPITITLSAGWGEAGGSTLSPFALGQSLTYIDQVGYSALQSKMSNYLPATDPISGAHAYWVPTAEEKALGLIGNNTNLDGAVGFSSRTSWNFNSTTGSGQYDFVGVAEHEISEALGRIALLGGTVGGTPSSYTPYDLFRFSDVSTRSLTAGCPH